MCSLSHPHPLWSVTVLYNGSDLMVGPGHSLHSSIQPRSGGKNSKSESEKTCWDKDNLLSGGNRKNENNSAKTITCHLSQAVWKTQSLSKSYTLKTFPSVFITDHDVICHGASVQSVGISCSCCASFQLLGQPSLLCLNLFDLKTEFSSFLLFGSVSLETEVENAVLTLLQLCNRFSQKNHYS